MKKHLVVTLAAVSTVALIGGAAAAGTAAAADSKGPNAIHHPAAKVQVSSCSGGALKSMSSRAMDFQSVAAGTSADLEGSQWSLKGPKKGTDTVLVTISALASGGGTGEALYLSLYRDGVGTGEGQKYFAYGDYKQASTQFCTKIGKGQHTLVVKASDNGGSASGLYDTTITYQRFN